MDPQNYERQRVHEWRALGRSWNSIGENLGKYPDDVRRKYDTEYQRPALVAVSKPEHFPEHAKPGLSKEARDALARSEEMAVLKLFYYADRPVLITGLDHALRRALERLGYHHDGGLTSRGNTNRGAVLTPKGRALYESMTQGGGE